MGFVCLTWFEPNFSDISIFEMPDMLSLPPMDPGFQLLPTSPAVDKKDLVQRGTVIDKNALGLDRAWFIYRVHCRPGIELKGRSRGMCLLSKRE